MKILVTGASSFVGAHLCTQAARRHDVLGLWRNTPLRIAGVRGQQADVTTHRPAPGTDVVIHLAMKVMADDAAAQNRRMLDAVLSWGLPVVYCSSTVVHWKEKNAYARSRMEDEERLRASGLPWLIIRPCAPFGPYHGEHQPAHRESFHTLSSLVYHLPVIPVIGKGDYRRQPVHVDDFSGSILGLLEKGTWNEAYDAGGSEALTFREIVEVIAKTAGKSVKVVSVPRAVAMQMAKVVPGFHPDVIKTFESDDVVDHLPLQAASGVVPRSFRDAASCLLWGAG